jgi:hypothetical protein
VSSLVPLVHAVMIVMASSKRKKGRDPRCMTRSRIYRHPRHRLVLVRDVTIGIASSQRKRPAVQSASSLPPPLPVDYCFGKEEWTSQSRARQNIRVARFASLPPCFPLLGGAYKPGWRWSRSTCHLFHDLLLFLPSIASCSTSSDLDFDLNLDHERLRPG